MHKKNWVLDKKIIGVDLGGTKVVAGLVDGVALLVEEASAASSNAKVDCEKNPDNPNCR